MPLYVCRWGNGDFSVAQATNKDHAIEMLDEVANAEGLPLYAIRDFMVHFRLTDNGTIELEGFGDDFEYTLADRIHPTLSEVQSAVHTDDKIDESRIRGAVEAERTRIKAKTSNAPDTELGKQLKSETDLPTVVVNKKVEAVAQEILRKTPTPKGKPN
jgi:hypothetical protein